MNCDLELTRSNYRVFVLMCIIVVLGVMILAINYNLDIDSDVY